jgi:ABC-type oligopeptide transport system substrate-binding subunit
MRKLGLAALLVALAGAVPASAARSSGALPAGGGTFRVAVVEEFSIDPATLGGTYASIEIADATCALLFRPEGTPEAAAGAPQVSRDGKTYTFHLRRTFRFQTGTKVTAANFVRMLDRLLSPALGSPGADYFTPIVGAQDVIDGKAEHARGVRTRGPYTLEITLTERTPDLPARLSAPYACAVPTGLPAAPGAVRAPFSGAGPYYVSEYVPGSRVVLRRNSYYRGPRPHRVDQIVVTVVADNDAGATALAAGEADWVIVGGGTALASLTPAQRAHVRQLDAPSPGVSFLAMNASRPLFRNNIPLRQAVNFALDRTEIVRSTNGGYPEAPWDHYLGPAMPGSSQVRVYPLHADVRRARALARGHTRGGRAVLYCKDAPATLAEVRVIERELARIGIRTIVHAFPFEQFRERVGNPHEPYDLVVTGWVPDYVDPYDVLNVLFEGNANVAHFNSPKWNRRLDRAALLIGPARLRAYGRLDAELARDAAPLAAFAHGTSRFFLSDRTGCIRVDPLGELDLASICVH